MFSPVDLIPVLSFIVYLIYLSAESVRHRRQLKERPRRIAVSGIRGKSSITRLIAAGLSQSGFRVMAKTTGSKPVFIFPDGHEEEIRRRGRPTILEQKKLMAVARAEKADFLVSEMMSIQPECLKVESRYLVKPELLVLSNFRVDHMEFLGSDRDRVARAMLTAIPPGTLVFMPEEERRPWMSELAKKKGIDLKVVTSSLESASLAGRLPYPEFETNVRLALAVLRHLGLSVCQAGCAWSDLSPDSGRPRAWKVRADRNQDFYLVSLFAANDPESSLLAMELVTHRMGWQENRKIGLLSLRADRGDRTEQWAEFLNSGRADFLESLVLAGRGARALRFKLRKGFSAGGRRVLVLKRARPGENLEEIRMIIEECQKNRPGPAEKTVVFGLGNIGGFGHKLIDYLERTADAVRI